MSLPPQEQQQQPPGSATTTEDTDAIQQQSLEYLQKLMDEYGELEETQENLLEMLEQIRSEEVCLVRALNDDVFTNPHYNEAAATTAAPEPTTNIPESSENPIFQHPGNQPISEKEDPPSKPTETETGGRLPPLKEPPRATAEPAARDAQDGSHTALPPEAGRKKRRLATAPHAAWQRREQTLLERQRLEDALFADDDDDDDSSLSSS